MNFLKGLKNFWGIFHSLEKCGPTLIENKLKKLTNRKDIWKLTNRKDIWKDMYS